MTGSVSSPLSTETAGVRRVPLTRGRRWALVALAALLGSWSAPALAQQGWTGSVALVSGLASSLGAPASANDTSGNVTAVWLQGSAPSGFVVMAARLSAATGSWGPPVALSPTGLPGADITVAAHGTDGVMAMWATTDGIHAARYSTTTGAWGPDVAVAHRQYAHGPDLAVDPSGNAVAVWYLDGSYQIEAARYAAATGTWSTAVPLSTGYLPDVTVDSAGNATAVWPAYPQFDRIQAVRYSAATGTWSAPVTVETASATGAQVVADASGNAIAVWLVLNAPGTHSIHASRLPAAAGTWDSPVVLATETIAPIPELAVASSGDAMVIWTTMNGSPVRYRRYSAVSGTWGVTGDVTTGSVQVAANARVDVDDLGNAIAVWPSASGPLQSARFSAAAQAWTPAVSLSAPGLWCIFPSVTLSPSGAGTVLWHASAGSVSALQGTQWVATPAAPLISGVSASTGALAVAFVPPASNEAAFAPTNYDYSLDGGATWVARNPASTASPLAVGGLVDFVTYPLRLRASNAAGAGVATAPLGVVAGAGSAAPTGLSATIAADNTVTFTWDPPTVGAVPTGYLLEGGVAPGQTLASLPTGSATPTLTVAAPTGVFYLRIRAVAGALQSQPSNEIRLLVNVPAPPSAPANLLGLATGSTLGLSWTNTFEGGSPTSIWLVVSGALVGAAPIPMGETFAFPGVSPGTYTLQVVAVNGSGPSGPSNPVTLTFPGTCSGVPGPPTRFVATTTGATVTLAWSPPQTGAAVTSYTLSVTGTYAGSLATTARTLSGALPAGTYTFRVVATNPCGDSAPAAPQTVIVP